MPMGDIKDYIASGILEMYVLGLTDAAENAEIEQMAITHPAVQKEIEEISSAIESYGKDNVVNPDPTIKPFLMAVADYTDRISRGETPSNPPLLNPQSTIADYAEWINRDDMVLPDHFDEFYAKIIGLTAAVTTAIVWIKTGAPEETHQHELEHFLVLEGSCDIVIEGTVHQLVPGSVLSIPLFKKHHVAITSAIPCKIILQRMAA